MNTMNQPMNQGTEGGSREGGGEARHVHSGRFGPHAPQEAGQAQARGEGGGLLRLFHRMGRRSHRGNSTHKRCTCILYPVSVSCVLYPVCVPSSFCSFLDGRESSSQGSINYAIFFLVGRGGGKSPRWYQSYHKMVNLYHTPLAHPPPAVPRLMRFTYILILYLLLMQTSNRDVEIFLPSMETSMRFAKEQLSRRPPGGVKWPEGRGRVPGAMTTAPTPSNTVSERAA